MGEIQSTNTGERTELVQNLTKLFKGIMTFSESQGLNQLAEEDLTFTQIRTLLVASSGEPLGISQIAESLCVSMPAASRGVDSLTRQGLLARRTSDEDRRVKLVTITEKGSELLNAHAEAHERALASFVESLPPGQAEALAGAVQPIVADPRFAERSCSAFCD